MDFYNRFLLEPNYARNIVSPQEQQRRERHAGYVEGKRPATGPPRPEMLTQYLTPLTQAAIGGGVAPPPYHG